MLVSLELELEAVVSQQMWVLGTKLKSPVRTGSPLRAEPSIQASFLFCFVFGKHVTMKHTNM